jgi:hypothetical protein
MKSGILALLILLSAMPSQGQGITSPPRPDSTREFHPILVDPGMTTGKSSLLLPESLQPSESSGDVSLFDLWKHTSYRPPLLGGMSEPKADLMATLRAQKPEGWVGTMRMVLGTVQLTAVGYLAYRALTSKDDPKPIKKK